MPAVLGPLLGGATSIHFDRDGADPACPVRQLPAFLEAAAQQRLQPLRPLTHRLRCGGGAAGHAGGLPRLWRFF